MKLLGIDFGTKRIGVAIGDTETKIASPLFTLESDENFFNALRQLVEEEKIQAIVVGLPKSLQGKRTSGGETEALMQKFVKQLSLQINIPIHLEDERFSTDLATQLIGPKGKDRDAVAAAIILQSYLDRVTGNR